MTGCLYKTLDGAMQTRQHAGLGAGSQSCTQRAVGRCRQPVQKPDERMDSVQACCCEGCLAASSWESRMFAGIPAIRQLLGCATGIDTPSPRPLTVAYGGHPEIFPCFSCERFPLFFPDEG